MDEDTLYTAGCLLALQLLYLLVDYLIYRSKDPHKGLLDYLHGKLNRANGTDPRLLSAMSSSDAAPPGPNTAS